MGTKRIGLKRTQALIENLKRELKLNGSTFTGGKQDVISLTGAGATQTLTAGDSGALVLLAGSDASTVDLPTIAEGLRFTFYAATAEAHVIQGGATKIDGVIYDNSNGTTLARNAVSGKSKFTLVNPAIGDSLEFYCDGTDWFVRGWLNQTPSIA